MSDQENFLTRWSRRKLEPADEKVPAQPPQTTDASPAGEEAAKAAAMASARQGEAAALPEFDVSQLPSLDSIGANSDIRAFLQAGVPAALKHAALRRAWSSDPAIRDYIGPNENFWEGVGMDNVPGFGALDPGVDVKKLVAEVFGDAEPTQHTDGSAPAEANVPAPIANESTPTETKKQLTQNTDPLLQRDANVASQYDESRERAEATKGRRHGSAMPQ
ncbi:MAG: DUF3306 domain-containing protein [Rhizobiales bacterium]|nr:DUF3306 domain-containing protein [Hyphomicrobiales bacterium]